jgi:hypothetical protein
VNVVIVPLQIVLPGLAVMLLPGTTTGFTVIVTALLTDAGVGQAALLVITHITLSPLLSVLLLKVAWLLPTVTPFTLHV